MSPQWRWDTLTSPHKVVKMSAHTHTHPHTTTHTPTGICYYMETFLRIHFPQLLYLMSAFQNKIKRACLPHKAKCSMFYTHMMHILPRYRQNSNNWNSYSLWNNLLFRVWSVRVALVWLILPSGDMGYMCIKFEHSHTLFLGFFANGTLNYVSIRSCLHNGGEVLSHVSIR